MLRYKSITFRTKGLRGWAILLLMIITPFLSKGDDSGWWNALHGWQPGMPGWRMWINISPGYLGPNALPVPELKRGIITNKSEVELSADFHFMKGDPTQDIAGRIYIPFANEKIALELYGVMVEKYQMSDAVRDERIARDRDGKGVTQGDLYFSTLVQLVKDRKFPNTLLRMAVKTASGGAYNAARYSDSPGYFFDLSFTNKRKPDKISGVNVFATVGFYSWQTTDADNLQNDAFLYGGGLEYFKGSWTAATSLSGYMGYKDERDQPVVVNIDVRKDFGQKALRLQYIKGLKDWKYTTLKFSFIWYFKGVN